ncbi:MAG: hypothetical protein IT242_11235 [Bacteroidia bacterium]|nr:hypothetical protein [Bacteroidia bacterium]
MLCNIVNNEELLTSQIVKSILLILLITGIVFNVLRIIRTGSNTRKIINAGILSLLIVIIVFVFREFRVEAALLKYPEYVTGTTTGTCSVFARGQGIEFEYEINGQTYRNCNTYYPVSKDSIVVPGGKYQVRYTNKFPDKGRMDFRIHAN